MSMKIVSLLLGWVTGDKNYAPTLELSGMDLLSVFWRRGLQFGRGLIRRITLHRVEGAFFLGHGAKIRHGSLFQCGRSVVIEDDALLDALGTLGIKFGNRVTIGRGTTMVCTGVIKHLGHGVELGNNVGINAGCYIGGQGGVSIGNDVIMGPGVKIFSENHNFADTNVAIRLQGESRSPVRIEENCWIGANAMILAGVSLGAGCVVAAGSVVTKSAPGNTILAGVPARVLRLRE